MSAARVTLQQLSPIILMLMLVGAALFVNAWFSDPKTAQARPVLMTVQLPATIPTPETQEQKDLKSLKYRITAIERKLRQAEAAAGN